MARTITTDLGSWDNFHNTGPFPTEKFQRTFLESPADMPNALQRYNDGAIEIRRLIQEAVDAGQGFRAIGSAWSLSSIAHHHERMQSNVRMNLKFPINASDIHQQSTFQNEQLFFFQCGNTIKEISEFLFDHGKSLKTSGASNGQTIAGAVSTGVHGSAVFFGSIQDSVVGLNIITGPTANDIVYLERKSAPALRNQFAQKIKARVIRDDDLFNAALVGLGAFGFIHGVLVEVENLFLLNRQTTKLWKNDIYKLIHDFKFENVADHFTSARDKNGNILPLYHFKIFINPYNKERKWMVEAMFKEDYREDYEDPVPKIRKALYTDLVAFFSKFIAKFPKAIPALSQALEQQATPPPDLDVEGCLKEIFWDAPHFGAVFAVAVAVDIKDAVKVIEKLKNLARKNPVPGAYAVRFVTGTKATLGFTRYPKTCIMEMDGVQWKGNRKIISPATFYANIIHALKEDGISFTHHWGKNAKWDTPNLVEHMYGAERIKAWKTNRAKLLTPSMAKVFSSPFLDTIGLSDLPAGGPDDGVVT